MLNLPGIELIDGAAGGASPSKERQLDQFYTRPDVAAACMAHVIRITGGQASLWLEPSAGTGTFLDLMPTPRLGLDLDDTSPHSEVVCGVNFLEWAGWRHLPKPIITVGNPPFGQNGKLAIDFLQHAMKFSDYVCMILPRTFQKESAKAKINNLFEVIHEEPLAPFAFIHQSKEYDVPCCFQIWRRVPNGGRRPTATRRLTHSHFRFVENPAHADFAFQRVGARAGLASVEGLQKSWKSHHFIKAAGVPDAQAIMDTINSIDWGEVIERNAGNPSIGKAELVEAYSELGGPSIDAQHSLL